MMVPAVPMSDAAFCKVFFKIIKSGAENNFEDLKGVSLGITMKGYNKIEKWKSVENFEGFEEGIISKSFGTSYIANLTAHSELNDNLKRTFDQLALIIDDCLSPNWVIFEMPREGLYKRVSISRRDADEAVKFPSITMEVIQQEGKYILQLRIVK